MAIPQFAPRRADLHIINPLVRLAKISFEQYFLYKVPWPSDPLLLS